MKPTIIIDAPEKMPVAEMRELFESSVRSTARLRESTPLGTLEINGRFHHYMEPDTDTLWIGFALGLRCAERLSKQRKGESS